MPRLLRFTFTQAGVSGRVELHESLAPRTVDAIWGALAEPVRELSFHAMYAGPEIMIGLPEAARSFDPRALPPENQTVIPAPGDVLWFYQAPNLMKGLSDEFWEVGMFYGEGGRVFGPLGWTPVSMFGRMLPEDLPGFARECADIRLHGAKMLEIRRGD
ncbi:DUF3830 family protein [Roseomonas sp. BN140053]|uniref:DUF3830 family protein n=1 Tax=Roseomonas sp. BN140053 TaxID=3391898 RepID=UPI0039EA5081